MTVHRRILFHVLSPKNLQKRQYPMVEVSKGQQISANEVIQPHIQTRISIHANTNTHAWLLHNYGRIVFRNRWLLLHDIIEGELYLGNGFSMAILTLQTQMTTDHLNNTWKYQTFVLIIDALLICSSCSVMNFNNGMSKVTAETTILCLVVRYE